MNTEIYRYGDVKEKIFSGLSKLTDPIVQTLTPKGRNVIYQGGDGNMYVTNDGFTIARNINLEDPVENAIVEIVRNSALRTNSVAGDGTTTSILLSDSMIRNGFSLIEKGWNHMDLKRALDTVSTALSDEIDARRTKVTNDIQLEYVARVSANNDEDIAKNVARIIKRSGVDGMVFIEDSNKDQVEVIEESGFIIDRGLYSQHLANRPGGFVASYEDATVFVTDKRIYYEEEVLELFRSVSALGENKIVIVAADFIGQAPGILISNHLDPKINMNVLLIKETDTEALDDLATYLGGNAALEKNGSFAAKMKKFREEGKLNELQDMFCFAKKVFVDGRRTVMLGEEGMNIPLDLRLKAIREQLKGVEPESKDESKLRRRIACLTNGITTIKIGGKTAPEIRERIYRYEDAINATRNALREGYVVGGGITLFDVGKKVLAKKLKGLHPDIKGLVETFCQASLKQIATNCDLHFKSMLDKVTPIIGYDAVSNSYTNLLEAGIIEPVVVLKNAVQNSISVAQVLLSSDYLIILKEKENGKENK